MVLIVKIPSDEAVPLSEEEILHDKSESILDRGGDAIPYYLRAIRMNNAMVGGNDIVVDSTPLIRMTHPSQDQKGSISIDALAGLYAYSISSTSESESTSPNIRATRLAMACGCHSHRFVGDVWVGRLGYIPGQHSDYELTNLDLMISDIEYAARYSPDLRREFAGVMQQEFKANYCVPEWLGNASQKNYHDGASIAALADAMTREGTLLSQEDESDQDNSSSSSSCSSDDSSTYDKKKDATVDNESSQGKSSTEVLTGITLCLHCRGPASTLCKGCGGAYFCDDPRKCKIYGWSHQCLCSTWKVYVQRRSELSSFPHFSGWQTALLQEDCFTSETSYQHFLTNVLGVITSTQPASGTVGSATKQNWWATELHGWSGGGSLSSKDVNHFRRVTYRDGFALKNSAWIPDERHITDDDISRANAEAINEAGERDNNLNPIQIDEHGLPVLTSWEDYYRIRSLPLSSPVALLATFPLTIYYAIQKYGIVPLTVAQILERPLRIHVVGIEKELNFVDLFKELGFLLPESVTVSMTWIIREDMFPENSQERQLSLQLTKNLKLSIIGGTYGHSLNPDFDMGGPPDMIIGMNAGLFAYESWRHVVSYLHHNKNVVGVFTDYNEHSGMNCASLGGWESVNSLEINPFRQMRAMPVYCMNLPQFSNGFVYVFNEQEIDD